MYHCQAMNNSVQNLLYKNDNIYFQTSYTNKQLWCIPVYPFVYSNIYLPNIGFNNNDTSLNMREDHMLNPINYTNKNMHYMINANSCNKANDGNAKECTNEMLKNILHRIKFSTEEDEKLKKLVEKMGCKKWENIAKNMPGRTGRQCRDRYQNYLIPGFFSGQWSKEEDELLLKKYQEIGPHWSQIAMFFKNRNANALKNRWNDFVSKHLDDISNRITIKNTLNKIDNSLSLITAKDKEKNDYDNLENFEQFDDTFDCVSNNFPSLSFEF